MPLYLDPQKVWQRIPEMEQEWYEVVHQTLFERRKNGIDDVDTETAFKEPMLRLDPTGKTWNFWRRWGIYSPQNVPEYDVPGDSERALVFERPDVTDETFNKPPEGLLEVKDLTQEQLDKLPEPEREEREQAIAHNNQLWAEKRAWQEALYDREMKRRTHGLWVFLPWFLALDKEEQEKAFEDRPHECLMQCLTGHNYFFLVYTHIVYEDETGNNVYDFPLLRRRDCWLFLMETVCQKKKLQPLENRPQVDAAKPRRVGYTTIKLSIVLNEVTRQPRWAGSIHLNQGDLCADYFEKNFRPMYEYMPKWALPTRPVKGGGRAPFVVLKPQKFKATFEVKYWDYEKGQEAPSNETSWFQVVGPDSKYVERLKLDYVWRDELPKVDSDKVSSWVTAQDKTLVSATGRVRTKYGSSGGTSNSTNPKGLKAWQNRYHQMAVNNAYLFFGGSQYYYKPDALGWCREQEFLDYDAKVRAELQAQGAYQDLIDHRLQNATQVADCYVLSEGSRFNIGACHAQIDAIKEALQTGKLQPSYGEFVFNEQNPFQPAWREANIKHGELPKWTIYEWPPEGWAFGTPYAPPQVLPSYSAGSDNVSMNTEGREDEVKRALQGKGKLSLTCMYIVNTVTGAIVAQYLYRQTNPVADYMQKMMGCIKYGCKMMPESNIPGEINFFRTYEAAGLGQGWWLKRYIHRTPERPEFPNHGNKKSYGVAVKSNKEMLIEAYLHPIFNEVLDAQTNDLVRNHWYSQRLMDDLANWTTETQRDPDTGMAMLMTAIAREQNKQALAYSERVQVTPEQSLLAQRFSQGSRSMQTIGNLWRG